MTGRDASQTIGLCYLARGADLNWLESCRQFLNSYRQFHSGIDHTLYIIFKGFADTAELTIAENMFSGVRHKSIFLDDDSLDIGAYIEWANLIEQELICVLNTTSEILDKYWLRKLAVNLANPTVGLVGVTGSYESMREWNSSFPGFPNYHLRSNAFMINRRLFCRISEGLTITGKLAAFQFESGRNSLTRQILAAGLDVLLVGRNGRGYSPKWWPVSDTFRQGRQHNLLVADNQTRNFDAAPWAEKEEFIRRTWGHSAV